MANVKSWTRGQVGEPGFPEGFEIVTKAVLQVTDIKTNRNKYYAIELHEAKGGTTSLFRVFTHYGRTDDLETNPDAGAKECRYFDCLPEARSCYEKIYREKTSATKGYKEISLASSKIGSQQARGTGVGEVDAKTLAKIAPSEDEAKPAPKISTLHPGVQSLIRTLYDEATKALTSTVSAKITAHGIETPLGILTVGQIEKGESILADLYEVFAKQTARNRDAKLIDLSGEFYTAIPHRIGRTRAAVEAAVINTLESFEQKQQTLQLMKDMLQVNGEGGSVLFDAKIDDEYAALSCRVEWLDPAESAFRELKDYVEGSQVKSKKVKVKNVYQVRREAEWAAFNEPIGNFKMLFHGSRAPNWVGLLSRGILLPKIVVSLGVNRTDAGWLGNGIYFGNAACTSSFYTTPAKDGSRFMAVAWVALGKVKEFTKITYGLAGPPPGFDSCHGVRHQTGKPSQFEDDEFVVYQTDQQRMEYLVEFAA